VGGGDDLRMVDGAGDAEVGVRGAVVRVEVTADVLDREALDVRPRADDALAERVVLEGEAARDVVRVDLVALLVVVLVDLLEDERALELDVGEPRLAEQLAEQVDALLDVLGLEGELE